jgi:hypothetical protein
MMDEFHTMKRGELELVPFLFFLLVHGIKFRRGILPQCPHHHPGSDLDLPSLFQRPQLLTVGTVHFPSHHVLGHGNAS